MSTNQDSKKKPEILRYKDSNLFFYRDEKGQLFQMDFTKQNLGISKTKKKDFDEQGNKSLLSRNNEDTQTPCNKIKEENDMLKLNRAPGYKPDESTAMQEKRITDCMETTGMSYEDCSKKIKKVSTMAENKVKDMDKEESDNEEETEEEDKKEKKTDTIEICKKEYDFLIKQSEKLKKIKEEKESLENDMISFKQDFQELNKYVDNLKEKEAKQTEDKRQDMIKKLTTDFSRLQEDQIKDKTLKELNELGDILYGVINNEKEDMLSIEQKDDMEGAEDYVKKINDRFKMDI